ncbi:MAG: serine hydrolase domain-containing protein, partial [Acidimicrobiales bacterium]|nr:serine hydrolase domain-containing protein [Acidimicrobiales bacterium]
PDARAAVVGAGGRVLAARGDTTLAGDWASVTKICTALAVLVAVEEEAVGLDEPAGPPGSTVRHLLAHASGLAYDGEQVLAPPGRRRIYSNAGFEVLGRLVAERAGMGFDAYLSEAVLGPLGMAGSRLGPSGPLSGQLEGSPAAGVTGTLDDLVRLAGELLAPTLVAQATLDLATTVAFPGLAGRLPGFDTQDPLDWGLGIEIRGAKSPHWTGRRNSPATFGHFGQSGSFLWVDPAAGLACAVLSGRDFGPWAKEAWPALSDAVLADTR